MKQNIQSVEQYIQLFPPNVQELLRTMRKVITENAPEANEEFSYGMVGYKLNKKPLVYFGGFEKHIGFYATPSGHTQFSKQLAHYKQGKGSVQFPLNQPLPLDLIAEIVRYRVQENEQR